MITRPRESSVFTEKAEFTLSDRDIIKKYLGIEKFPCKLQSPLRDGDRRPSFSMQEKDGKIFWKDFGTGEHGDAVSLMAALWNVSNKEAFLKIRIDTETTIPGLTRKYRGKIHLSGGTSIIKVHVRDWKDWDVKYWASYGISQKFCEACDVHPISHAFFIRHNVETGKDESVCVPMDKYAYAYFEWKDGKQSIKLYQPFSQTMKWLSKHDSSVWDLWRQAFTWAENVSDRAVILTSSRKDAMCLWEQLKIPAMSLQGEGYIPKLQVMRQVFGKFRKVYIWYDNDFSHEHDNPGQDNARKLCEEYPELINICIPDVLRCKDPSDVMKMYGPKKGKQALKKIFRNAKDKT
ncbi:MAG: toprim domain-containing protein [Bacteroidales bacterium]|nr:toprim domain-containing protein [Bacteroidales bacterium]